MFSKKEIRVAMRIVRDLEIPEQFGLHDYDHDEVEDIIADQLPSCVKANVESGISKIVIVPQNLPFVIKIPFNGQFLWDDEDEEYFSPYYNARPDGSYDYCARELALIERAEYFGWGFMVPHAEYLTHVCGRPVYIQEKVRCGAHGQTSENSLKCAQQMDMYYKYGPVEWRAAVIEKYGEPIWHSFVDWCNSATEDYSILDDLHCANVGIAYDGRPVILDVGGFSD